MGRSFYIITGLIGFLAGVGLYLVWQPSFLFLFVFLVSFCCLFFALALRQSGREISRPYWRDWLIALSLFFIFLCLGLMRGGLAEHRVSPEQIDYYNGQKIEVIGVITETDVRRDKAKYTVKTDTLASSRPERSEVEKSLNKLDDQLTDRDLSTSVEMTRGSEVVEMSGDVLITLNKYPQYHYGDKVKIYGELVEPGEFNGFNYGNYLSRYGVYSVMYYPYIEVLEEGHGNFFWAGMTWMQNKFLSQINKLLPEPHASFEAGLLVGARKGIPEDLMNKFNITGLTHIIAISGYNITIIIVFVMWMLAGLPRKMGFYVAISAIVLFTLFVGASPAVTRASIMGILGLIALNHGRQNNIHITVLFSACFMVLWNPKILWWDVGFQLSFAAVLGLIYVAPLFKKYAEKLPKAFGVREAIQMTLSAQVMALPIIIYNFERLSLIAPIANLFVIFAIPPAMLFGFVAVMLSFFSHILGLIPAYLAWGILSYIISVIEIASDIPYASIDLPGMKLWMMGGYYVALIGFLIWWSYGRDTLQRVSTNDGNPKNP